MESPLVFESQLVCLSDYIERQIDRNAYILHQEEEIKSKVIVLAGSDFHKDIVDLVVLISKREEFWLDLEFGHMYPSDKGRDLFWTYLRVGLSRSKCQSCIET